MSSPRLRLALPALRASNLCAPVVPVGGITRLGCGLLFYSPGSPSPSQVGIVSSVGDSTLQFLAGGMSITTNNLDFAASYGLPDPPYNVHQHGDIHTRLGSVLPRSSGYIQAQLGYQHDDIRPGVGFFSLVDATFAQGTRRGITGSVNFDVSGQPGAGQAIGSSPGSCTVALEVRTADKFVRGWSDPGGDPRRTDIGVTTANGPFYSSLFCFNDVNGFKGGGSFGRTVVTTGHAITFSKGPANGSVRISVGGIVQTFPGPVNYMNLSALGAGTWDPNAGVFYPANVRYEFFSAAALGGVLVADLTIPLSWGGDTIGAP